MSDDRINYDLALGLQKLQKALALLIEVGKKLEANQFVIDRVRRELNKPHETNRKLH